MSRVIGEVTGAILTLLGYDGADFQNILVDANGWLKVRIMGSVAEPHAVTHQDLGTDEIVVGGLSGLLADAQTPLAHKASHQVGGADVLSVAGLSGSLVDRQDASALQGRSVLDIAPTANDRLCWNAGFSRWEPKPREQPLAHKASHQVGGADVLSVDGLSGSLVDRQDASALQGRAVLDIAPSDSDVLTWDATIARWKPAVGGAGVGGFYNAYICARDKKPQGTHSGTFTSGAWRVRDINDEQADTAGICTIAANQITLEAGTYRCLISCPTHRVDRHQTRLYNVTTAAVLLLGTGEFTEDVYRATTRSFIKGLFTLAGVSTLEIHHRCSLTSTFNGLGVEMNFTDEIYTIAEFWRLA